MPEGCLHAGATLHAIDMTATPGALRARYRTVVAMLMMLALQAVLNNGPCMDSPKAVPQTLGGSGVAAAIVKIEKVISTATMIDGQVIGFLYQREDGTTWLGQRRQEYMSAADSDALNKVLASTHLPGAKITVFPPVRKYGVKTYYEDTFQVRVPPAALAPLRITLEPCVSWPPGMELPSSLP